MKKLILFIALALPALAQTGVPLSALRTEAPSERMLIYIPSIGILALQFDPAQITIDRTTTPFTVRLAAQAPPPPAPVESRVDIEPAVGQIITEHTVVDAIKPGTLKVFVNGLLGREGKDYTLVQNATGGPTIRFVPSVVLVGPSAPGAWGYLASVFYVKQ